jgi:hypothetical protein
MGRRADRSPPGRHDLFELDDEGRAARGAAGDVAAEHPGDERVQRRRNVADDVTGSADRKREELREDLDSVLPLEEPLAGQALEEDAAEREHVGATVDRLGADSLLRRHVAERAEQRPGASGERRRAPPWRAGHPEVDQHRAVAPPP